MNKEDAIKRLEDYIPYLATEEWKECYQMAIEALSKQIPKKPIFNELDEWYECPMCNKAVSFDGDNCDYCPSCGQKIDWSEDD